MRKLSFILVFLIFKISVSAQSNSQPGKLKVYIDCTSTWCDMNFIKTEITVVDFMLDQQASDVHVLITDQRTGGRRQAIPADFIRAE